MAKSKPGMCLHRCIHVEGMRKTIRFFFYAWIYSEKRTSDRGLRYQCDNKKKNITKTKPIKLGTVPIFPHRLLDLRLTPQTLLKPCRHLGTAVKERTTVNSGSLASRDKNPSPTGSAPCFLEVGAWWEAKLLQAWAHRRCTVCHVFVHHSAHRATKPVWHPCGCSRSPTTHSPFKEFRRATSESRTHLLLVWAEPNRLERPRRTGSCSEHHFSGICGSGKAG